MPDGNSGGTARRVARTLRIAQRPIPGHEKAGTIPHQFPEDGWVITQSPHRAVCRKTRSAFAGMGRRTWSALQDWMRLPASWDGPCPPIDFADRRTWSALQTRRAAIAS